MKIKLVAFYLPQFHEIPENNEAWGDGFTEWVNVKKASPLFPGHNQPRIPLNNEYYNLLDCTVMEKQMEIAKENGIYGFCYYHYWFNGKKILEKPTEIMLNNPNATLPFCFAWANEAWTKTWHGAKGAKEVLIRQTYGNRKDWELHYKYLSLFFKDERYIKRDNKPLFLVYKINDMRHRSEMFECFNELAKEDGFDGLFLVQMLSDENPPSMLKWINGYVDFEPARIRNRIRQAMLTDDTFEFRNVIIQKAAGKCDILLDYKEINEILVNSLHEKDHFRCSFVDYDDSPRRGNSSMIFENATPDLFGYYLEKQIKKAEAEDNDMLFINAWNEWGEGNYLEPDSQSGYRKLEMIRRLCLRS